MAKTVIIEIEFDHDDIEEAANFSSFSDLADPANDNYQYFLSSSGNIFDRYKYYNGLDGNSPETISDTDRGLLTSEGRDKLGEWWHLSPKK